ncbi:MAG TPA: phosphatidylglycerophosphatase A, partial [Acidiferrobacteraceae bacterium]|nr:phosphatidylglycerophosphatase A [Acidiferrobacteraceae bacterium]
MTISGDAMRTQRPPGLPRSAWFFATGGGSGLSPWAPGTCGSLVGVLLHWGLALFPTVLQLAVLGVCIAGGVWVSERTARALRVRDPAVIVWDEVTGMLLAAVPAGHDGWALLLAFGLFRLLDILKPPPIGALERLSGGWGIMADDVAAGLITALV